MQSEEVKSLLKDTTSKAVEDGAFGLPFIILRQGKDHLGIDDETFFGSDRFEVIAHKLGTKTFWAYLPGTLFLTFIGNSKIVLFYIYFS